MFLLFILFFSVSSDTNLTKCELFITPQENSFFIGVETVYSISRIFDVNKDRVIANGEEIEMSSTRFRHVDTDENNEIKVFELNDALLDKKISLHGLNENQSKRIAKAICRGYKISINSLGILGKKIDTNHDGAVSEKEMAEILYKGNVVISGPYVVGLNGFGMPE